jgi:hypothetical protein
MCSRQTSCVSPKCRWADLPRRCHRFDQFTAQITSHEGRPLSAQDQMQIWLFSPLFRLRVANGRALPSRALKPPAGPLWVHEVKHDGID